MASLPARCIVGVRLRVEQRDIDRGLEAVERRVVSAFK